MSEVVLIPSEEEKLWGAVYLLRKDFEALSIRLNQLERVVNRLSHWCSAAVEGTTIDHDMWAINEMGEGEWENIELRLPEQEQLTYSADTHIQGKLMGWTQLTAHGDVGGLEEGTYWAPLFEKPVPKEETE